MPTDDEVIGTVGVLLIGTRGKDGPGEVLVRIRGGSEAYLAWSEEPLPQGRSVLVLACRSNRQVDVMEWTGDPEPEN